MAYRTLDDDEAQRLTGTGTVGATSVLGGAPASSNSAAPAAPASRFVGFDRFLAANRGAAEATAGRIADGVDAAHRRAQDAAGAVRSEVDAATPATAQATRTIGAAAAPSVTNAPMPTGTYGLSGASPAATLTGSGPRQGAEASSYGAYTTAAHDAQTAAANTGTMGGLQQLIGTGSGGAGRFDAGLVGAVGERRFGEQRSRYGALASALDPAGYTGTPRAPAAAATAQRAAPASRQPQSIDEEMLRRRRDPNIRRGGF